MRSKHPGQNRPHEGRASTSDYWLDRTEAASVITAVRVARDPIRKLRRDDRLVGAALLSLEQGIEPVEIVGGIVAALRFDLPDDSSAVLLQSELEQQGLAAVLVHRCDLAPDHPLFHRIAAAMGA